MLYAISNSHWLYGKLHFNTRTFLHQWALVAHIAFLQPLSITKFKLPVATFFYLSLRASTGTKLGNVSSSFNTELLQQI